MRPPLLLIAGALSALLPSLRAADDDLFTGVPKNEFERRAEKFHVQKWNAVVEASDAAPLRIPESSRTSAQVGQAEAALMRKHLAVPALAQVPENHPKAERWRAMVEQVVQWLNLSGAAPVAFAADAEEIAKGKERRPALDYIAARVLEVSGRRKQAMPLHASAASGEGVPLLYRMTSQARLVSLTQEFDGGNTDKTLEKFWEIFAAYAAAPIPEAEQQMHLRYHFANTLNTLRLKREERYIEEVRKSAWPDWMKLTIVGEAEIALAQRDYDHVYRSDIPQKGGVKQLEEHLTLAREALLQAWQLNRTSPLAPAFMIKVVMRGYGPKGDTPRTWLDRAVAAQCDDWRAFEYYLNAIRPRYGGSHELMLSFGRACALTGRFDTEIPTQFNESIREIGQNAEDWPSLYRHPEIAQLLIETRRQRLAKAQGTNWENKQRSLLFLELYLVGDVAGAAELLPKIRTADGAPVFAEDFPQAARDLGLDYRHVWAEVECLASPIASDWAQAQKLRAKGEFRESADVLKAALPKAQPGIVQRAAATQLALDEFQAGFPKGEWLRLPWDDAAYWRVLVGEHTRMEKEGRLRVTCSTPFGRQFHRATLGTRFELRGKVNVSRRGGLSFMFGHPGIGTGLSVAYWWTLRLDNRSPTEHAANLVELWANDNEPKRFPAKNGSDFLIRRLGRKVTFIIDGQELFSRELPNGISGDADTFGIGVIVASRGAFAELWDLEARCLPE